MEKSSYLNLFDKDKQGLPYESQNEYFSDIKKGMSLLLTLMEKRKAGVISAELAARDLALGRLHIEGRAAVSAKDSLRYAENRLELNSAEKMVFLLALSNEEKWLKPEEFPRILGNGRHQGLGFAKEIYNFCVEQEESTREPVRLEKLQLFLKWGWQERPSGQEISLMLRKPVLDFLWKTKFKEKLQNTRLEPVYLYKELLSQMERMCRTENEDWTLCLMGQVGSGKKFLARHLAKLLEKEIIFIDGKKGSEIGAEERQDWLLDISCHCRLEEAFPCLVQGEAIYEEVRAFMNGVLIAVTSEEEWGSSRKNLVMLKLPEPSATEKAMLWKEFLKEYPHEQTISYEALGSKYVLNAGEIRKALYAAYKWAKGNERDNLAEEDIVWAIQQSQAGQLGNFAASVPCVFGWEDLIVEEKVRTQLAYICGRLKYRSLVGNQWGFYKKMPYGRGLCALFYGPPGTGKTMAVQVIAKELGLELYRVDLSQMVSKYIGETEKNISSLFDKARHMNIILFFDEADAFFSKRSEVKDANDRNANGEVAHLLQKLEEYEGISILATNLKENMDDAFKRRIQFMVNFRLPSLETRKKLWRSLLPKEAPIEPDLDLDFFAEQFELSGSQIKEILVGAAFIAAGDGTSIGNRQIKEALCINFEKYGKVLTEKDFGYLGE